MTVQELMAKLVAFDPDMPVAVEDWQGYNCAAEVTEVVSLSNSLYFSGLSEDKVRGSFILIMASIL